MFTQPVLSRLMDSRLHPIPQNILFDSANTDSIRASARPLGVVRSSAWLSDTKPASSMAGPRQATPGIQSTTGPALTVSSHFSRWRLTATIYTIAVKNSRHGLIGVLAVVLCLPAATIAWFGFRLIEQDRALESQRVTEGREQAANKAVQTLFALLSDTALLTKNPGDGALLVHLPGSPLLYRRAAPAEVSVESFRDGENLEFQQGDPKRAIEIYRKRIQSANPLLREGALLRLGRALGKSGKVEEALGVYAVLAKMETSTAEGWPAPIAASWSRCRLFESAGRSRDLHQEAMHLRQILLQGRYLLSRTAYVTFADDAARWCGLSRPTVLERLTDAALELEAQVRASRQPSSGNSLLTVDGESVVVVWAETRGLLAIFAATSAFVEREWLSKTEPGIWLRDDRGRELGTVRQGQTALRHPMESRLPWTVLAVAPAQGEAVAARRRLLLILIGAVGVFTLAGAYFVVRVVRKELVLARMQDDFVAAVSHEFRTPLTTLRQMTEALDDGRVTSPEHRASYYRSLSGATNRLHRLVEDLLDFRRMQSGALEYRRTRLNARELTQRIVSDFQREAAPQGFEIVARSAPDVHLVGDPEALSRALWNLLDNAVKYSGKSRSVELSVDQHDRSIAWVVHDHGIGIPASEIPRVFHKFYRGDEARHAGIRGTGIGLAMVEQIVEAHHGRVSISSEPGVGSVVTMTIPMEDAECHAS
jgi:signal transduction histidine kinase